MHGIENEDEIIDVGKKRKCKQRHFNQARLAHILSSLTPGLFRNTLLNLRDHWWLRITLLCLEKALRGLCRGTGTSKRPWCRLLYRRPSVLCVTYPISCRGRRSAHLSICVCPTSCAETLPCNHRGITSRTGTWRYLRHSCAPLNETFYPAPPQGIREG